MGGEASSQKHSQAEPLQEFIKQKTPQKREVEG